MTYKTEQESFWAGTFGDEYVERNKSQALLASNIAFWSRILVQYGPVHSVLELGANIGMNLMALDLLFPAYEWRERR
jgi:spore coat polysaccharide biosynthesis protein SpsF